MKKEIAEQLADCINWIRYTFIQDFNGTWQDKDGKKYLSEEIANLYLELQQQKPQEKKTKDWVEDFLRENGNYQNICICCKHEFMGHRRRHVCKECYDKAQKLKVEPQPVQEDKIV